MPQEFALGMNFQYAIRYLSLGYPGSAQDCSHLLDSFLVFKIRPIHQLLSCGYPAVRKQRSRTVVHAYSGNPALRAADMRSSLWASFL